MTSLGESLMKPTTMLYRNLMAMDVEESIRSYPLDGVVLLTGCARPTRPRSWGRARRTFRDRRHRRPDAHRPLARRGARLVLRLLALQRGAPSRTDHRGGVHRDRERDVSLERPLPDDGDRLDDGVHDRGARADAARGRGDPGGRLAPRARRGGGGHADRRAGGAASARPTFSPATRSRTRSGAARDLRIDECADPPCGIRREARDRPSAVAVRRAGRRHALARST